MPVLLLIYPYTFTGITTIYIYIYILELTTRCQRPSMWVVHGVFNNLSTAPYRIFQSRAARIQAKRIKWYIKEVGVIIGQNWGVSDKLLYYLIASRFIVHTASNPLTCIQTKKKRSRARMGVWPACFEVKIIYRAGKKTHRRMHSLDCTTKAAKTKMWKRTKLRCALMTIACGTTSLYQLSLRVSIEEQYKIAQVKSYTLERRTSKFHMDRDREQLSKLQKQDPAIARLIHSWSQWPKPSYKERKDEPR